MKMVSRLELVIENRNNQFEGLKASQGISLLRFHHSLSFSFRAFWLETACICKLKPISSNIRVLYCAHADIKEMVQFAETEWTEFPKVGLLFFVLLDI